MKIVVDRVRCEGHGACEQAAPQIFHLDEAGELIAEYDDQVLPSELEESAELAARVCPVAALLIVA
jgi:ferredoxin